jgi:hypothetical protein
MVQVDEDVYAEPKFTIRAAPARVLGSEEKLSSSSVGDVDTAAETKEKSHEEQVLDGSAAISQEDHKKDGISYEVGLIPGVLS